jgi:hypothetical protein
VLLFVFVTVSSCGGSREPGRYYNDENSFSIDFPDEWMLREGDGIDSPLIESVSPWEDDEDLFSEYVGVDIDELTGKADLKECFDEFKREQAQEFDHYEELESGDVEIDEIDAKYIVFDIGMEEGYNRVLAFLLVKGSREYFISCVAERSKFDDYRPVFEDVAHSFRCE